MEVSEPMGKNTQRGELFAGRFKYSWERLIPAIVAWRDCSKLQTMVETPFDSIDSAHEYVSMLGTQVDIVEGDIAVEIALAGHEAAARRLDALRLVDYKVKQLKQHLVASSRILNDLRALRRLLLREPRNAGAR
jgi:hypothetical protein